MKSIRFFYFVFILLVCLFSSNVVRAHGFGQRYDLPVPLSLWVLGAGITIVLSFILIAMFATTTFEQFHYSRINLLKSGFFRMLIKPFVLFLIRLIGVIILVTAIIAGYWGDTNPYNNVTPVLVWVIWWVGVVYVSVLVGDLWSLINPFRTLFLWAEVLLEQGFGLSNLSRNFPYPKSWQMWPAVIGLIGFFWAELLWTDGSDPRNLAGIITIYGCTTWLGMFLYGRETWLHNADPFSLVFRVFSGFSPMEIRVRLLGSQNKCQIYSCPQNSKDCVNGYSCVRYAKTDQVEWNLRPPGLGLLQSTSVPLSLMVFVLILLASVTFDGFLETPLWLSILDRSIAEEIFFIGNFALLLVPMLFFLIYVVFCWLMMRIVLASTSKMDSDRIVNTLDIACSFILTLVPIAIAYHLAHYLSFLLITGQYLIPLISDPLGLGWNIFGTSGYRPNIGVIDARISWYIAVGAVVSGHVASVYIAHKTALSIFRNVRTALYSQIPMIVLMVLYTMLSLWILAQPMVE